MCLVAAESCNGTHDFGFVRKLFSHHVTVTFDATVKKYVPNKVACACLYT